MERFIPIKGIITRNKTWKPWYLMEDGYLVKYSFSIYKKKVKKDAVSS